MTDTLKDTACGAPGSAGVPLAPVRPESALAANKHGCGRNAWRNARAPRVWPLQNARIARGMAWIVLLLLLVCAATNAQGGKAELSGGVLDSDGLPVAQATVELEEQATRLRQAAATSEQGQYHFFGLAPGIYTVTVEKTGFKTLRQHGLRVRLAERVSLDIRLEVGDVVQAVEVTATAPLLRLAAHAVGRQSFPRRDRSFIFSRRADHGPPVFDAAILTGPVANFPVADSFNRRLERDVSNGDMPHKSRAALFMSFLGAKESASL